MRHKTTENFCDWSDKDKEIYWKREEEKKEKQRKDLAAERYSDPIMGLNDNDGW